MSKEFNEFIRVSNENAELRRKLDAALAALESIDKYDWALGDADPKTMARQDRIELKADAFGDVVSIARRCLDRIK